MKKGFTLIELLAVILILGVIAMIAVPQVTNTIEKSKKGAAETSAKHYIDAVTNAVGLNQLDEDEANDINDGTHSVSDLTVDISGEPPQSGTVVIEEGSVKSANFVINGYNVVCTGKGKCSVQGKYINKTAGAYSSNNKLLATWDELVNTYGMDMNWCANGECEALYYSQEKIDKGNAPEEITTPGWYYYKSGGYIVEISEPINKYFYALQDDVDKYGSSYGMTSPGWYYWDDLLKKYVSVNINSVNSNQPAVVLGKLGATKLVIDKSVETIQDYAFYGVPLTSVEIPNSVTSIGEYAFQSNQLTSVTIPDSVTSIGLYAFANNQLASVEIPDSVITIEHYAFEYNQLTSVTIGNSVRKIGWQAFYDNKLTSVDIPNSVTSIGSFAFAFNQLTNITIPSGVTSIEYGAFSHNQLTSVEFNNLSGWTVCSGPRFVESNGVRRCPGGNLVENIDLSNTSTNATYLKDTYKEDTFIRNY